MHPTKLLYLVFLLEITLRCCEGSGNSRNFETDSNLEKSHIHLQNMQIDSDEDERNRRRSKNKQVRNPPPQTPQMFNGNVPGTEGKGALLELFCGDTGVRIFVEVGKDGKFSEVLPPEFLAAFQDERCNVTRNLAVYTVKNGMFSKSCNKCYVDVLPLEYFKFGEHEQNVFEVDFKKQKHKYKSIEINGHKARKCLKSWVLRERDCEKYFNIK